MGARILIIEDNPANLELMTYLLTAFGHTVLAAGDGQRGLKAARREHPDLIISDVQLPDIDGLEVARWLKSDPELRSTLEDWILVGLRLGHKLPVLAGIDLNKAKNARVATT